MNTSNESSGLAPELKKLVNFAVGLLGQVIQRERGEKEFARIERIRQDMTAFRDQNNEQNFKSLEKLFAELEVLSKQDRHTVATSFTLMLELINTCENAYRSFRRESRAPAEIKNYPEAIIYVLTAHPTEARAPQSIEIFHQIQKLLTEILDGQKNITTAEAPLLHLLEIAWRTPLVRNRSPRVKDEAEHIYSTFFRPEIIESLLDFSAERTNFFARTWVGGDKDGHPGVNEKTLKESLQLSRIELIKLCARHRAQIHGSLHLFPSHQLIQELRKIDRSFDALKRMQTADGKRVQKLREDLAKYEIFYEKTLGAVHPDLKRLRQILVTFPGLVVPLELRESSDVLMAKPEKHKKAIEKMLAEVARFSKGGDPRWYARGFIISMTESIDHIRAAGKMQKAAFGKLALPIIPLFEEARTLADAENIVGAMIADKSIFEAANKFWDKKLELMVGYSDSAKEAGVLASRMGIARALPRLEALCEKVKLQPVFFHGSGGSVDRGGGSIEDQTAWWPRSALRLYKVTVQGEVVERSLASPAIARGQLEHILESASRGLSKKTGAPPSEALEKFSHEVAAHYHERITSPSFLEMVEKATPYSYLRFLKIGSRPAKRTTTLTVAGLRAIPWVMCWTQTRILFPTWWGLGSAWEKASTSEKEKLRASFQNEAVFTSYIKALGFTLAKMDLAVWHLYLSKSGLEENKIKSSLQEFSEELRLCRKCFEEITGQKDPVWSKAWLAESIWLRSPMIHPLNVLQILAERDHDSNLLRLSVTGISSGMLTTG